jgi:hypothetical protein
VQSDNASGAPVTEPRPGRLSSMYLPLQFTDLILRRREAPSRSSVSLEVVLRDARKSALLRTRLIDASI